VIPTADVRWIKIVTDIFDDEKILLIESMPEADAIIVIWFKLLCLAGKQNNSGVFLLNGRIAYTDEMFATIFRMPLNTVRLALQTFEQFGMIEIVNGVVSIPNWGRHSILDNKQELRFTPEYRKWRKDVFKRDDYSCRRCGKRGGKLNAHHIKPFAQYPKLRFELSNGITLCEPCHRQIHNRERVS